MLSKLRRLSPYHQGFAYLALGTFLFSTKGILIKLAYEWQVTPVLLMTVRMLMAMPFYLWVLRSQFKSGIAVNLSLLQIGACLFFGLFGYYIASLLDLTGLLYLPASLERLILYSYPTLVLLLSLVFLGQRLQLAHIVSLLIIYAGLFSVFIPDLQTMNADIFSSDLALGAALVFASSAAFAVFLIGSEVMMRTLPSRLFTSIAMLGASLAIVVHYLLSYPLAAILHLPLPVYAYGFFIAIFCTVIPSFLVASGIGRVGAATGSMVGAISPVFTVILALFILGESISSWLILGFVLVIVGVLNLSRLKDQG